MFGTSHLNTSYGLTGIARRFRFKPKSGSKYLLTSVYLYFSILRVGNPTRSKSAKQQHEAHSALQRYVCRSWLPFVRRDLCIDVQHSSSFSYFFLNPVITFILQFQNKFRSGSFHDTTFVKHMHNIRFDIIEQTLVVSNNELCLFRGVFSLFTPSATIRSASMSKPESVSSRMLNRGSSIAI